MKALSKKARDIYIFGLENELVKISTVAEIAKELHISAAQINYNIRRKSLWNSRYYFCPDRSFKIPEKKIISNPLAANTSQHQKFSKEVDLYFRNKKTEDDE